MFLLVNHPRGSVVLLPASGHCATLSIDGGAPIDLSGCQVYLCGADGRMAWGDSARERPGDRYLVRMDAIFQRQMDVKGALLDSAIDCCALNARFVVSGGSWAEAPASDPMFADTQWTFVRPDKTTYVQPLTDRATWSLPLDQDYTLVVAKYRKGQPTVIVRQTISARTSHDVLVMNDDCAEGNKDCPCANADRSPKPTTAAPASFNPGVVLREFEILFGLMNAGLTPDPPYGAPAASPSASGIFRSSGGQLCGAGQTDPPDPPDPPDPGDPPPPRGFAMTAAKPKRSKRP
jgi:hypothetical protein